MNRIELIDKSYCTACGACMHVCPTRSISFKEDKYGNAYPEINRETCISCGKCKNSCHIEITQINDDAPSKAYVAWNSIEEFRRSSASGGIAAAFYKYALKKNYRCYGVVYSREQGAVFQEIKSEDDIRLAQNSKYVYSNISKIFESALSYLKQGETVIVPALPCQTASLKTLAGGNLSKLFLIDIVCHGVCSNNFLDQHINNIEKNKKVVVDNVSFRDPEAGTDRFILSLFEKGKRVYSAKVLEKDVYQLGYHKALIYRDNCYRCKYAQNKRVGDITISDFTGLGRIDEYNGPRSSISCVLISTKKGERLFNALISEGVIECQERPTEEAFLYEKQLMHPSIPHKKRELFKEEYEKRNDFDKSAKVALRKELFYYYSGLRRVKKIYRKIFRKKLSGEKDTWTIRVKRRNC